MNHKKSGPVVHPHVRMDDGNAFLSDPADGPARVDDDLAEKLAEEFLTSATSGEEQGEEGHEEVVDEESGGPFEITSASTEFAQGTDESNPADAEREPFPTVGSQS